MNQKLKTLYLIGISVVTVICMIIGLVVHIQGTHIGVGSGDNLVYDQDVDAFDSVNLNIAEANVSIEYGDAYHIYYSYWEKSKPEIKVENGTLSIVEKNKNLHFIGVDFEECELIITVPEDTEFTSFECTADAGNVTLDAVTIQDFDVTADAGNVEVTGSNLGDVSINADAGNIELDEDSFDSGSLEADMGNITVKDADFDQAECSADAGNITVSGDFGKLSAECDMGNITVDTDRDEDQVKLDLKTEMGSVKLNGRKIDAVSVNL